MAALVLLRECSQGKPGMGEENKVGKGKGGKRRCDLK